MLSVDFEVAVERENARSGHQFRHSHQACIRKRHGEVRISADKPAQRVAFRDHVELDDQQITGKKFEEAPVAVAKTAEKVEGLGQHGFAGDEGRNKGAELLNCPRMEIIRIDQKGDQRPAIHDDP